MMCVRWNEYRFDDIDIDILCLPNVLTKWYLLEAELKICKQIPISWLLSKLLLT
jgi:hypothetical protein